MSQQNGYTKTKETLEELTFSKIVQCNKARGRGTSIVNCINSLLSFNRLRIIFAKPERRFQVVEAPETSPYLSVSTTKASLFSPIK